MENLNWTGRIAKLVGLFRAKTNAESMIASVSKMLEEASGHSGGVKIFSEDYGEVICDMSNVGEDFQDYLEDKKEQLRVINQQIKQLTEEDENSSNK